MRSKSYHLQELKYSRLQVRLVRGNQTVRSLLYVQEELFAVLHATRDPRLFINIGSSQSLRLRLLEPALSVPSPGLLLRRAAKEVSIIGRVRLDVFCMSVRVVELAFIAKQLSQPVVNPKQLIVPVGRRSASKSNLVMVNGLLPFPLGSIYVGENTVRSAD